MVAVAFYAGLVGGFLFGMMVAALFIVGGDA